MLTGDEINGPSTFLVFLNGLIIGIHVRPLVFVERLRELRRAGRIGEFISVYINENQKAVYVASDGGRVCRPLLIVDKKTSRILLTDEHIKALTSNSIRLEDLLASGIIEYVDVNEENNCLVGLIEYELTAAHTHMEIDPMTILGEFASSAVCITHLLTHSLTDHRNCGWTHSLSASQSKSAQHVSMRHGQASDRYNRTEPVRAHRHTALHDGIVNLLSL